MSKYDKSRFSMSSHLNKLSNETIQHHSEYLSINPQGVQRNNNGGQAKLKTI